MKNALSGLTFLVGLALITTPWVFHFTADRVALSTVVIGGLIVTLLGILLTVEASLTGHAARQGR